MLVSADGNFVWPSASRLAAGLAACSALQMLAPCMKNKADTLVAFSFLYYTFDVRKARRWRKEAQNRGFVTDARRI